MSKNLDKDPAKERQERKGYDLVLIIDWVKEGDCVVLHHKNSSLVYHNKCDENKDEKLQDKTRFIFVDMGAFPSLMEEDEWPWYLKDKQCNNCKCGFTNLLNSKDLKYSTHMAITI